MRPNVTRSTLDDRARELSTAVEVRVVKHGPGAFVSNAEALGVVVEEYHELVDAVRSNDDGAVYAELMDVAVACLWALASMHARRPLRAARAAHDADKKEGGK